MRAYKSHFAMIVDSVLALLMGIAMAISVSIIESKPITWTSIVSMWAEITFVIIIVVLLFPITKWGGAFAKLCKCQEGTIVYTLVENIIPTAVINTALSAVLPALGIFYNESIPQADRMAHWQHAFISGWPKTFVVSFFLSIIAAKIGIAVAKKTLD